MHVNISKKLLNEKSHKDKELSPSQTKNKCRHIVNKNLVEY